MKHTGYHHSLSVPDAMAQFGVTAESGLSQAEATRRLAQYGPNRIAARGKIGKLTIFLNQLVNPVVYLLTGAALLALVFDQQLEAMAVLFVLLVNTGIGYWTQLKAVRSMEALRSLGHRSSRVRRDGRTRILPAQELVPGDIVIAEAGDMIAADLRIIASSNLGADESTFTGESVPVEKSVEPVPEQARLADQTSMLFKGTAITRGSATGVVTGTGIDTELGRISQLVADADPSRSPLEKRLTGIAGQLVWMTLLLAGAIVAIGMVRNADPLLMVTTGIALAVAAIPEGLPVVATLALAQGMWRMARKNALIERLSAVETFGSTTLILTDKTGTLTENRMSVAATCLPAEPLVAANFAPANRAKGSPLLAAMLEVGTLCNASELDDSEDGGIGDPMEVALLRAGADAGLDGNTLLAGCPLVCEHAFDTSTRMMATVHRTQDGFLYAVKGAPESVLAHCTQLRFGDGDKDFSGQASRQWAAMVDTLASEGMRILALASKHSTSADDDPYGDLVLHGLVGLADPPRPDVADAIAACRRAGIEIAIVTGDHTVTALSIGRQVGLLAEDDSAIEGHDLTGSELDGAALHSTRIFARVNPDEKLALVRAFQQSGEVVAMTGDGVNDAPALRQADIGVAMGMRGTDVAREAAAMVLLDDAFPTIVMAIREGRIIFENIRRFAAYLLSCNLSEVLAVGMAVLLALPLPILPLQILFLNLVTDVFPAFALAMAKGDDKVMLRPPRPTDEALLGARQWRRIALHGLALAGATFGAMAIGANGLGLTGAELVTVTFLTLAFSQLWHVFNMRHPDSPLLRNEVTCNPWVWAAIAFCTLLLLAAVYVPTLAAVLGLVPPDMAMWIVTLGMSIAPLAALQLTSALARMRKMRSAP